MAFRYRGKANYRDSIYLTYDCREAIYSDYADVIVTNYIEDLYLSAKKILQIGTTYCIMKIKKGDWSSFTSDVDQNNYIEFAFDEINKI